MTTSRRSFIALAAVALMTRRLPALGAAPTPITIYKSPTCGCCKDWIAYLKPLGFAAKVVDQTDEQMSELKMTMGVPSSVWSCHTAVVSNYVIEGHVPAEDIRKMLATKPPILGLSAPGMPQSSPGMYRAGDPRVPYDVVAWSRGGKVQTFAKH
ncbi:MAG: DUF411 domain-containing protein [Gemmatimonadaceae bacterium]|nr:DUF411 domain-containing protein [Gemmatimonadaceae bacterium]